VVAALVDLGVGEIQLAARRPQALEAVLRDCRGWAPQLQGVVWSDDGDGLAPAVAAADLLVNTTPVGMASATDPAAALACPLAEPELAALAADCWVYDLIYTPRPTALLQRAAERGCACLDGLEMLVQQGAAALRLWTDGASVPLEVMRQAALAQLQQAARPA
jgi:shikimate dehydrogenase